MVLISVQLINTHNPEPVVQKICMYLQAYSDTNVR
uniref:Uncharacterized protein n=1 Tax=Anguilla anguilla TaxID=7936 RepID=A0A0E9RKY5_ANGAN